MVGGYGGLVVAIDCGKVCRGGERCQGLLLGGGESLESGEEDDGGGHDSCDWNNHLRLRDGGGEARGVEDYLDGGRELVTLQVMA